MAYFIEAYMSLVPNYVVSVLINGKGVVEVEKGFIWLGAMHLLRVHIYSKHTHTHTHIR